MYGIFWVTENHKNENVTDLSLGTNEVINQIMAYAKTINLNLLVLLALYHQKCVFIDKFFFFFFFPPTGEGGKERKNTKTGRER